MLLLSACFCLAPRAELPDANDFSTLDGQTRLSAFPVAKGIFPKRQTLAPSCATVPAELADAVVNPYIGYRLWAATFAAAHGGVRYPGDLSGDRPVIGSPAVSIVQGLRARGSFPGAAHA